MAYINGKKVFSVVKESGKPEQTKTAALSMASGDQVVTPDENKTLSQVTITKPATLIAGNIKNGVNIGGVVGDFAGIIPTGNKNITDTSQTDVTNYATAQVVDANLTAENIKDGVTVLGVQGTLKAGAALNIEYNATTAPSDTSKLWVKTNTEPTKVSLRNWFYGSADAVSLQSVGNLDSMLSYLRTAIVGTKIYLFGGYSSGIDQYIRIFDTETNTLTKLTTPTLYNSYAMGCAAVGTKIYLLGGKVGSTDYSNKIKVFDTETNTIETLTATLNIGCNHPGCAAVGTKIYLFGGNTGSSSYTNKIQVFDTETNTTSTLTTTLPSSDSFSTINSKCPVVGTKIYLGIFNRVFDTETNTLTTPSTTLPSNYIGGVVGTKIYYFYNTYEVKVFDTETNTLTTLSTILSTQGNNMGCCEVGTKIYLFGGSNSTTISCFTSVIQLTQNELQITNNLGTRRVKIINDSAVDLEISPVGVYIGDSNGQGQVVKAAIYDEDNSQWVEIN